MSRGGRGRGGKRGLDIPTSWDVASVQVDNTPSELFPPYNIPIAEPPTERERREVRSYLRLLDDIRQGPLYTKPRIRNQGKPVKTYGEEQFNELHDNSLKNDIDPFNGVPRYSWKYTPEKHIMPDVSGSEFDKMFFPEELWATLEGKDGASARNPGKTGTTPKPAVAMGQSESSNPTSQEKAQRMMEKIKKFADADEGETGADAEEEEEEVDEREAGDYNFEDDDDEMGGDYGAEQYFDNGDGDDDDGGDGGGGGIY